MYYNCECRNSQRKFATFLNYAYIYTYIQSISKLIKNPFCLPSRGISGCANTIQNQLLLISYLTVIDAVRTDICLFIIPIEIPAVYTMAMTPKAVQIII